MLFRSLVFTNTYYLDMFPLLVTLIISSILIFYLSTYFDRISSGEISGYYYSFSIMSNIFLFAQTLIIFNSLLNKNETAIKIFTDTTFSLLGLLGVINFLLVITIGIILNYYSTQG